MPTCWQARRKCRTRFGVCASFPQDPAWAVITAESSSTPQLQSATICRAPCLHYYHRLRNRRGKVEARGLISFIKEKKLDIAHLLFLLGFQDECLRARGDVGEAPEPAEKHIPCNTSRSTDELAVCGFL